MNTTRPASILPSLLLASLSIFVLAERGAVAEVRPAPAKSLPATITYTDAQTGKDVQLAGRLEFRFLPVLIDGRPRQIAFMHMVSSGRFTAWVKRVDRDKSQEEPRFVVCASHLLTACNLNFERIDVELFQTPATPLTDGEGDDEEDDVVELEDETPRREPSPVRLLVKEEPEDLESIPASAIQYVKVHAKR